MARTCLMLLLLAFSAFSASADSIIDCGGSEVFTDDNSVVWMGDDSFMQGIGESKVVQATNGISGAMTTLRVFTTRKKNCYTFDDVDRGARVLVRASFYYGNYDKKSAPPTFDLHFDGNLWGTVETSLDKVDYAEVSYVVKTTTTSVCLAQTHPNQFPFISALELRILSSGMYNQLDSSYALLTMSRIAYGANSTIRYSDDDYDRIWTPATLGSGLTVLTNDADPLFIDNSVDEVPPKALFEKAVAPLTAKGSLSFTPNFPTGETPIYVNMYFTEVRELLTGEKRAFQVYMDGKPFNSDPPIVPVYEKVFERIIYNTTATANTSFSLLPTPDSTLPPLINAIELFAVNGPLTDGTNSNDVKGLSALQTELDGILGQWGGDPCLPSPYSWEWINCTSDPVPRVTALYLGSFDLSGRLPDFSSMDALEIIDMHNNSISGPIPDFLGAFPNLKELNLANNAFTGPIPASLSKIKKLNVSGNPQLCVSGTSCQSTDTTTGSGYSVGGGRKKKSNKVPVIVGTTIPAFVLFWAILGFCIVSHSKRKRAAIAAAAGTTPGGDNGPHGTLQAQGGTAQGGRNNLMGKISEAVVNEIKVNIQDQVTSAMGNQSNPQGQQGIGVGS